MIFSTRMKTAKTIIFLPFNGRKWNEKEDGALKNLFMCRGRHLTDAEKFLSGPVSHQVTSKITNLLT